MTQESPFKTTVSKAPEGLRIAVSGPIDERAEFASSGAEIWRARGTGVGELIFDLSGVSQLNSVGVKKWLAFVGSLAGQFKLRFDRVSEQIVAQANVVAQMLGPPGTPVGSFFAPYLCEGCGRETSRELRLQDLTPADDGWSAPALKCECGGKLVFDEYEDEYFFFLKRALGQ